MATWLESKDKPDQLTLEGFTNIDSFSTPDDLESWSPTEDLISKYAEDPPALIAYVAQISCAIFEMKKSIGLV